MTSAESVTAGGFTNSANTVLLVVTIISSAVAIVALLGGLAVVFGGSWRKSEMEMLRQSRADLTSVNGEQAAELAAGKAESAAKDRKIAELTSLVTQRQPFEQITVALEKHHEDAEIIHKQILEGVERIASTLDAIRG